MRHRRSRFGVCTIAVAALLLAACGGDDDSSSATAPAATSVTSAQPTASAESSTDPAPTSAALPDTVAAPAGPATGEPIKLMNISTLESPVFSAPQVQTAIEARVAALNAAGGVNGRPLEVEFCNDKFDPNEAQACARKAVDDGVVAVVGSLNLYAGNIFPILSEAGIPWIGGGGSSGDIELTDPISYPIHGGTPGMIIGVGKAMVEHGAQTVSIVADDNPGSANGAGLFKQGIELGGATAETFTAPQGTVDYSALVAQATASNPDGIAIATVPANAAKFVKSLREAGYDGVVGGVSSAFPAAAIEALGADAVGILLGFRMVPATNTDNATVAQFISEMTAEDPSAQIDELGLDPWNVIDFFATVAGRLDTIDSASIRNYLDDLPEPVEMTILPAYGSLTAPAEYPRARNFVCVLGQIENGTVVQLGDFFNPLA